MNPQQPDSPKKSKSVKAKQPKKKHTGRTVAWIIVTVIVVVALVVGGVFVYNHHFRKGSATAGKSQTKAIIKDNVIVYHSAGDALTNSSASGSSSKKSGKKAVWKYPKNSPEILSITDNSVHVRASQKPKTGQVMSAAASKTVPNGVLRTITKVTPSSKGKNEYDLDTKSASVTDAVEKADQTSKVTLPVTSDQIAAKPADGSFEALDMKSMLRENDNLDNIDDIWLDPFLALRNNENVGFFDDDYAHASGTMTDQLAFSAGQNQKNGFATTGQHEISVGLKIANHKVSLAVTDHVKATVLDRWDAGMQTAMDGLVYYFNKPLTVMIGRMPLTLTPTMVMTVYFTTGNATQGTAKLVTNLDHTIGAKYQTGKPIQAIDKDSSALGNSMYGYNTVSRGPVASYDYGYMKVDAHDCAALLARFSVNGFNVETGILERNNTKGAYQKIPNGQDSSGAFTLPGVDGKLRGYLTPLSHLYTSVAAGTDSQLAGLDGSKPKTVANIHKAKKDLTRPKLSFGKVVDMSWLANVKYTTLKDSHYETIMQIKTDGSFTADHFEMNGADWPTGKAHVSGKFSIPTGASKDKPFTMHLDNLVYQHQPDKQQTYDVSIPDGGPVEYNAIASGFYGEEDKTKVNLQTDLLHDYMVYPAGTAESLIPQAIRDSQNYDLTQAGGNGKTNATIIVGLKNGKPISEAFIDETYSNEHSSYDE